MNIPVDTNRFVMKVLALVALLLSWASCDSVIFDEEGDCSVTYRLHFRYDMNLKFADAFANEVKSVALYAFDSDGVLVWQKSEKGSVLASEGYAMTLDLLPGDYRLIAWCGLDNEGEHGESFTVPETQIGKTREEELRCSLNRKRDGASAYSDERLYPLFHGSLEVSLPANDDGDDYDYTMYLTKDTNHVRIILQHLSGEDVNVNDFTFSIEDANGDMASDNTLLNGENILYKEWLTQNGEAGVDIRNDAGKRAVTNVKMAMADLTVARMVDSHRNRMMLTIRNKDGETVAHIPVIDYALLSKDYYEMEFNRRMSNQEFLDREDEYVMTFFLDEDNHWVSSVILINSWRVVLSDVGLN